MPSHCACGKIFAVGHALSCLKGGFIHRRHDEIRDLLAAIIHEVAHDVFIEPGLQCPAKLRLPVPTLLMTLVLISPREFSSRDVKKHSLT